MGKKFNSKQSTIWILDEDPYTSARAQTKKRLRGSITTLSLCLRSSYMVSNGIRSEKILAQIKEHYPEKLEDIVPCYPPDAHKLIVGMYFRKEYRFTRVCMQNFMMMLNLYEVYLGEYEKRSGSKASDIEKDYETLDWMKSFPPHRVPLLKNDKYDPLTNYPWIYIIPIRYRKNEGLIDSMRAYYKSFFRAVDPVEEYGIDADVPDWLQNTAQIHQM